MLDEFLPSRLALLSLHICNKCGVAERSEASSQHMHSIVLAVRIPRAARKDILGRHFKKILLHTPLISCKEVPWHLRGRHKQLQLQLQFCRRMYFLDSEKIIQMALN